MIVIPDGTPVVQHVRDSDLTTARLQTGGRQPCRAQRWRCPATSAAPGLIMRSLECYLIDELCLPEDFAVRVSDCACEAVANAGQNGRGGTDVQVTCLVVGEGLARRCSVKVFNYSLPDAELFPRLEDIPPPDLGQRWQATRGRGLAMMKAQSDAMVLEDLPGHAKEVLLAFDLISSTH